MTSRKTPTPTPAPAPGKSEIEKSHHEKSLHEKSLHENKRSERSEHKTTSSSRNEKDANEMKARAAPAPAAPPRSGVKKFFLKISEKMGGIEQTQYSQQFMDSCQEFDNYKLAVEDLVTNLIGIAQQNPKFEPNPMSRMELDYPERENPYELLHPALKDVCALLKNEIEPKKQLDIAAKLGTLHRDFHRRTRRALRNIRYFLSNDFEELTEARNVLNQRRQDMDFAKHELKNAKAPEEVEMKNIVYENAQKLFESQLQKVLALLDAFPRHKDTHLKDVQAFYTIYKVYHDQMASAINFSK